MSRHDRQVSLASSYYPILIDPTINPQCTSANSSFSHPTPTPTLRHIPRLTYPYPLIILGLADLIYTLRTWTIPLLSASTSHTSHHPPGHLLGLSVIRALILLLGVGSSKHWRNRGGWIGSLGVVYLGSVVWEVCKGQLLRAGDEKVEVDYTFLIIVSSYSTTRTLGSILTCDMVIDLLTGNKLDFLVLHSGIRESRLPIYPPIYAIIIIPVEYSYLPMLTIIQLVFVLLLRLSPPSHRSHPFSLRVPPSAIQSPTAFTYSENPAGISTPTRRRFRNPSGDYRHSPFGIRPQTSLDSGNSNHVQDDEEGSDSGPNHDHLHRDESEDLGDGDDFVDDNDNDNDHDSVSSISDSSIIDLPPPLEPVRLLPPSVSLNTGLSLAALDSSPVIGPLIRRTRSARFTTSIRTLGRSASGVVGSHRYREGREMDTGDSNGYGTFGVERNGAEGV